MKKIILVVALLCAFSINAQEKTDYKQKTIEFIKLTGTADAFDNAIAQIGISVRKENMDAYKKEFSEAEIADLVEFYKTDLGIKLASKQTSLTQSAMMLGQNWGVQVGQIA